MSDAFPPDDADFEEVSVGEVNGDADHGWEIKRADGWSFGVQKDSPVIPVVGMTARFYGAGIGHTVRGLFLDGVKVYYRTKAEEKEFRELEMYGADATEWLKRWDDGKTVWSIEMGGLGPGYEQCIHITAAEILRHFLEKKYDPEMWEEKEIWKRDRDETEKVGFENPAIKNLGGISDAQWGAALNIAAMLYRRGPRAVMTDERVKDRHIQVSKSFPQ